MSRWNLLLVVACQGKIKDNPLMNKDYLTAMGIPVWTLRTTPPGLSPEQELNKLKSIVGQCTACPLHQTRSQTVFGVGNPQAEIMFIGEAPGFYEDKQGEPFVGRAGQLLNAMLQSIDLDRKTVYITNILKSRPPNNRDPAPSEIIACTPFLDKQIALIRPKLLVALGRIAGQYLLKTTLTLGKMREQPHQYQDIPLLVTYHPAYLLRNPSDKRKALVDLQRIQSVIF